MHATALLIAALSLTDVARMSRDEAAFGREVVATGVVTVATEWRTNSGVAADPENPNWAYPNSTSISFGIQTSFLFKVIHRM